MKTSTIFLISFFILFVTTVIIGIYLEVKKSKKLKKQFQDLIEKYSFKEVPDQEEEIVNHFGDLNILNKGFSHSFKIQNLLYGQWKQLGLGIFQHHMITGYFKGAWFPNSYISIFTKFGRNAVPEFDIIPKSRILNRKGNFKLAINEKSADFFLDYSIASHDPRWVKSKISPEMIELFKGIKYPFAIKCTGDMIFFVMNNKFVDPLTINSLLTRVSSVFKKFKS